MGMTMAEKIVARAAGLPLVRPGEYVTVTPDYTVCQEISWSARKAIMQRAGCSKLARPERVVMVVDHTTSAGMGTPYYQAHREMRDFATEQGAHFFGAGSGLRHHMMTENGFARPGALVFSDEPNIATVGVVGALNIAMSSEVVVTQLSESNWMMVPRSVRIRLEGALPEGVMARDLVQCIIRDYAEGDRLAQACIEYCGSAIAGLSLDERQSLLACSYHAGADTALMPLDDLAMAYVRARTGEAELPGLEADPDAAYDFEAVYDLSRLSPMITPPPALHLARPVTEFVGQHIDQACIGTCANSRMEDLRAAASVLRGKKIAGHVTLYVTPGSREIYAEASREGVLADLTEAGATILAPGCTTCWGYEGFLNAGEVQISTHQMNYNGRHGHQDARAYLASPLTVAASALRGVMTDPRSLTG